MSIIQLSVPRFDLIENTSGRMILENRTARRQSSFPFLIIGILAVVPLVGLLSYDAVYGPAGIRLRPFIWIGLAGLVLVAIGVLINLLRKRLIFDLKPRTFTVENRFQNRRSFTITDAASTEVVTKKTLGEDQGTYFSLILTINGEKFEVNRDESLQFINGIRARIESMRSPRPYGVDWEADPNVNSSRSRSEIKVLIDNDKCPFCHDRFMDGVELLVCKKCQTLHHRACWNEMGRCSTFGCEGAEFASVTAMKENE